MNNNSLIYKIAITLIEGIGDVNAKKLIAYCGGVEAVFKEKKQHLLKIQGIGEVLANSITKQDVLKRAEKEIKFIEQNNVTPLFYLDEYYPKRLKNCNDSPVMLYYKGKANLNNLKVISVVGTRNATEYGKKMTEQIVSELKETNCLVVSGLAYGIDVLAHRAALANDLPTVGVMAHGHDKLYPALHKKTAIQMLEKGGLLTEFLSETNPDRENFPKRNRIVAGMADAVLVVEAAVTGGALITADIANSYNRDVFAVPGKVGDVYSEGCNKFIMMNKAALATSAANIMYAMGWENKENQKKSKQPQLFLELSADEEKIVDLLKQHESLGIDEINHAVNYPVSKTAGVLLNLEFSNVIRQLPGKRYKLN